MSKTIVTQAIEAVQALQKAEGLTLDVAARVYCRRNRADALEVVDRIGNWPSSEPELAAIQRQWGRL